MTMKGGSPLSPLRRPIRIVPAKALVVERQAADESGPPPLENPAGTLNQAAH